MSFGSGKGTRLLIEDVDLSAFFSGTDVAREMKAEETTTYQPGVAAPARSYVVGLLNGHVTLRGYYDSSADAVDPSIRNALGAAAGQVFTWAPLGSGIGAAADLISSRYTKYTVHDPVDGAIAVDGEIQADGPVDDGVVVHDLTAETTTGTQGTSVDGGAATTNGGVAHLHCINTVAGTSPTCTVRLQDSADNSTFADIAAGAFTAMNNVRDATRRQRLVLAAGSTIRRYVREARVIGGSAGPTFTYAVALARR